MVEELRDSGKLAPRTIRRVYGTLHTLFQRALVDELVSMNPCVLGRHELGPNVDKDPEWRATAIYSREELECLISSDLVPWDRQVLYAIEGLAGLRHGEAVGFRWRNYDARMKPLGQIVVARSYDHDEDWPLPPRPCPFDARGHPCGVEAQGLGGDDGATADAGRSRHSFA